MDFNKMMGATLCEPILLKDKNRYTRLCRQQRAGVVVNVMAAAAAEEPDDDEVDVPQGSPRRDDGIRIPGLPDALPGLPVVGLAPVNNRGGAQLQHDDISDESSDSDEEKGVNYAPPPVVRMPDNKARPEQRQIGFGGIPGLPRPPPMFHQVKVNNAKAHVGPALAVPVAIAHMAPAAAPVAPAVPLTPQQMSPAEHRAAVDKFWEVSGKFQWRNSSDGIIPAMQVNNVIRKLSAADEQAFSAIYREVFMSSFAVIKGYGVFARNVGKDACMIVSHIIALGAEMYENLITDMEILQFLIDANECQSLNDYLPPQTRVDLKA